MCGSFLRLIDKVCSEREPCRLEASSTKSQWLRSQIAEVRGYFPYAVPVRPVARFSKKITRGRAPSFSAAGRWGRGGERRR